MPTAESMPESDPGETASESVAAPSRLPLRTLVSGRYLLTDVLGSGGMGTVYRALDQREGGAVALKVLHAALSERPQALRRFEREARALVGVSHPHLAPTLDAGTDSATGARFHVTPLLDGESLRDVVAREAPIGLDDALRLVLPVLSALEAVHAEGIVHRDVKPENVLVTRDARGAHPWLLDFGICKRMESNSALTADDTLLGTPSYMAPEQARGEGDVDARADVWAAGALLFELLTGSPPHLDPLPGRLLTRIITTTAKGESYCERGQNIRYAR